MSVDIHDVQDILSELPERDEMDRVIEGILKELDLEKHMLKTEEEESIVEEIVEAAMPEPVKELEEVDFGDYPGDPNKGLRLFSKLFWKPKYMPDHLVPVFTGYEHETPADIYVPPKKEFETFSFATTNGLKEIVVGPTGCGKTMMAEYYAAVTGRPFLRIDHNTELDKAEVFGQTHINVDDEGRQTTDFVLGVLPRSMDKPTLVVLDELTRAPTDAVIQYQRLLDRRQLALPQVKGEATVITPHADWILTATDNTKGNGDGLDVYSASNVQDAAIINRFDGIIEADYLSLADEKKLVSRMAPTLPAKEVENLCKFSQLMHKAFATREITVAFSPRNLSAVCKLITGGALAEHGLEPKLALELNFISRVPEAEMSDVRESLKSVYG